MPTYRNNTPVSITVNDPVGGTITFAPSETKTSVYILTDVRITMVRETPYYNPLLEETLLVMTTGASATFVTTDIASRYIRLTPASGTAEVFINSFANTPAMVIYEPVILTNKGKISTLYFRNVGSQTAQVDVKELW